MNPKRILAEVCDYFDVDPSRVLAHQRSKIHGIALGHAMALCIEFTQCSAADVARAYRREHTTVLKAQKRHAANLHPLYCRDHIALRARVEALKP